MLAIEYLRRKRGWTQYALARIARTHQPTISAIENGVLLPSDAVLDRLATALDVSPSFLLLRPVVVEEKVAFQGSDEQVAR